MGQATPEMIALQTKRFLNFVHNNNLNGTIPYILRSIYESNAGVWPFSIRVIPFENLNFTVS